MFQTRKKYFPASPFSYYSSSTHARFRRYSRGVIGKNVRTISGAVGDIGGGREICPQYRILSSPVTNVRLFSTSDVADSGNVTVPGRDKHRWRREESEGKSFIWGDRPCPTSATRRVFIIFYSGQTRRVTITAFQLTSVFSRRKHRFSLLLP